MSDWRKEATSDSEIIQRALQHFNQQQFHYTLNPPLLSRHTVDEFLFDTQEGFCEHYASAFTVMMRMAGIPARVVTGYQGGFYNTIGSYVLVRQSDAHAWSEVWVRGSGWTRIDPTAAVAPERVEQGAVDSLDQRRYLLDFEWLRNARNTFDLFQRGWNNWVVTFGADRQSRLFSIFGWEYLGPAKLVIVHDCHNPDHRCNHFSAGPHVVEIPVITKTGSIAAFMEKVHQKTGKGRVCFAPVNGRDGTRCKCRGSIRIQGDAIFRIAELYTLCRYSRDAGNQAELTDLINRFQPSSVAQ